MIHNRLKDTINYSLFLESKMNTNQDSLSEAFEAFSLEFATRLNAQGAKFPVSPQIAIQLKRLGYTDTEVHAAVIFKKASLNGDYELACQIFIEMLSNVFSLPVHLTPTQPSAQTPHIAITFLKDEINDCAQLIPTNFPFAACLKAEIEKYIYFDSQTPTITIINLLLEKHLYDLAAAAIIQIEEFLFVQKFYAKIEFRPQDYRDIDLEGLMFDSVDQAAMPQICIDAMKQLKINTNRKVKAIYLIERFKRLKNVRILIELIRYITFNFTNIKKGA